MMKVFSRRPHLIHAVLPRSARRAARQLKSTSSEHEAGQCRYVPKTDLQRGSKSLQRRVVYGRRADAGGQRVI